MQSGGPPQFTRRFSAALSRPPSRAAMRIAVGYALFGAGWILFSDLVLESIVGAATIRHYHLETLKGWLFIAITAGMLYFLIRRTFRVVRISETAREEIEARTKLLIERVRDYA